MGLGNPGPEFERTRHNLGAVTVGLLAERHRARLRRARSSSSLSAEVRMGGALVALAFPQTFMNDSGMAVASLVRRHGVEDLQRLVVIHDELDLPVGRVRVKLGGGSAGHNGLKSILAHLHDGGFVRVRIGVGKPPSPAEGANYLLRQAPKSERAALDAAVVAAADAVELIIAEGVQPAMNTVNAGT